jgi:hypothetical protein
MRASISVHPPSSSGRVHKGYSSLCGKIKIGPPSSSGQLHWGSPSSCGKMMDIINTVSSDSSDDEDSNDVQPVPPPPPKCGKHKALDDEDSNKKVNFNAFM